MEQSRQRSHYSDEKWKLHTLEELLADETPIPPDVVDGFITGASAILFSGPGGDGKSYEMLDMAMCVSRGVPWLGLDTQQTNVLIIDLENRLVRIRERVKMVMAGHTLTKCPPIYIAFGLDLRFDNDNVALEIADMAFRCEAKLIILDSLVDFLGEVDENSNPEMGQVAERIRRIVEYTSGSLVAIHHTPKNNSATPRGATALRNGVDVNILNSREGNTVTMTQDKNRCGPERTVVARLNWMDDEKFNLDPVGLRTGRETKPPDPDEAAILRVLEDGQWHTSSQVAEAVMEATRHARSTVHTKMRALVKDGILERQDNGAGRPYSVRRDIYDIIME